MRAFIVFFLFSCSRSARCAVRISLSDTCARHKRQSACGQFSYITPWNSEAHTAAICT